MNDWYIDAGAILRSREGSYFSKNSLGLYNIFYFWIHLVLWLSLPPLKKKKKKHSLPPGFDHCFWGIIAVGAQKAFTTQWRNLSTLVSFGVFMKKILSVAIQNALEKKLFLIWSTKHAAVNSSHETFKSLPATFNFCFSLFESREDWKWGRYSKTGFRNDIKTNKISKQINKYIYIFKNVSIFLNTSARKCRLIAHLSWN